MLLQNIKEGSGTYSVEAEPVAGCTVACVVESLSGRLVGAKLVYKSAPVVFLGVGFTKRVRYVPSMIKRIKRLMEPTIKQMTHRLRALEPEIRHSKTNKKLYKNYPNLLGKKSLDLH